MRKLNVQTVPQLLLVYSAITVNILFCPRSHERHERLPINEQLRRYTCICINMIIYFMKCNYLEIYYIS